MFQRISALINTSFHGVQQAALVVSVFTLASQILGLLRDRLLAGTYGAGASLDIYYTAFRIPDILFVAVASFFSFTILIPFFIERERKSHESAREFISTMFSGFMIMMSVVAMAAYFMMPWLVRLIAPGFEGSMLDTTIELSRWLILSPVILGLSNLFSTITQSQRKFLIYALSPVLYNIGIIAGILFLQPIFGLQGIIYGVIGGTILHLLIQLPVLLTSNYIPHFKIDVNWGHIWAVMRTSLPRTLTLAFSTITLTILGAMATTISSGSVAIFDLSKNLHSVPIALIGISFSVAAFPSLVILYEEGNIAMFARRIREAARHIIFWSIPVIGLFIVLRAQIVRVIFGTGRFDWTDTRLTAAVLALFVVSVAAHNVMLLLLRGYYAAQSTKKPLWIVGIGSIMTIIIGYIALRITQGSEIFIDFVSKLLRIPATGDAIIVVLPLAYSIGIIIICITLWLSFKNDFKNNKKESLLPTITHASIVTILIGVVSYGVLQILAPLMNLNTFWGIFGQGFIAGVIGIIIGAMAFMYLRTPEFAMLVRRSRKKIRPILSMPQYPDKEI